MVNYRKIIEFRFNGMAQRLIEVALDSSRNTTHYVVMKAEEKELRS